MYRSDEDGTGIEALRWTGLVVFALGLTVLVLVGNASAETGFEDGFNDGEIDEDKWTVNLADETNRCGAHSEPYALSFSGGGLNEDRKATTRPVDVSGGGDVSFYLKYGKDDNGCESVDGGSDGDEARLEYSTDDGSTWTEISTYDAGGYGDFTEVTEPIPDDARTTSTRFRWIQSFHAGVGYDEWAIDDVEIETRCPDDDQVAQGPLAVRASPDGEACAAVGPMQDTLPESIETPRVPSQSVETPPVVIPETCTPGDVVCTEETEVLPGQHVGTPSVPPQHVADSPVTIAGGASAQADSGHDEEGSIGPTDPDPAPIVICADGCPTPADPEATIVVDAEVTVEAQGERHTVNVTETVTTP